MRNRKRNTKKENVTVSDMAEIFGLYRLNRDDFTVFLEFSGHVNMVSIRCHFGGWKRRGYPTGSWDVALTGDAHDRIMNVVREVKAHALGLPFPGKDELEAQIRRAIEIRVAQELRGVTA